MRLVPAWPAFRVPSYPSWRLLYCRLSGLFVNKMYPALKPVVKDKCLYFDRPLWFTMWDTKSASRGAVGGGRAMRKEGIKRTLALLRVAGPAVALVHLPPHEEASPPGHCSPALSGR